MSSHPAVFHQSHECQHMPRSKRDLIIRHHGHHAFTSEGKIRPCHPSHAHFHFTVITEILVDSSLAPSFTLTAGVHYCFQVLHRLPRVVGSLFSWWPLAFRSGGTRLAHDYPLHAGFIPRSLSLNIARTTWTSILFRPSAGMNFL